MYTTLTLKCSYFVTLNIGQWYQFCNFKPWQNIIFWHEWQWELKWNYLIYVKRMNYKKKKLLRRAMYKLLNTK